MGNWSWWRAIATSFFLGNEATRSSTITARASNRAKFPAKRTESVSSSQIKPNCSPNGCGKTLTLAPVSNEPSAFRNRSPQLKKTTLTGVHLTKMNQYSEAAQIAQSYYDSLETDRIYTMIWGGEHIHFGIYLEPDDSIREAQERIVKMMATMLQQIGQNSQVIDLGAGYGGTARYLAKNYGCFVSCLNLGERQNQRNLAMNQVQNLSDRIEVKQGSFENIPYDDRSFDIVWSQDAMIHSGNRPQVLKEIRRVLKPGGELIFTDTLRNHDCSPEKLKPAFDRLQIKDAGSFRSYQSDLQELGFKKIQVTDLSQHVSTHYIRFRDEVLKRYDEILEQISKEAIDKIIKSIEPWIYFYQKGDMQWGVFYYHLPHH